jgi:sugar lactone lactonase YvrE
VPLASLGQANYASPYTIGTLAGLAGVYGTNDWTGSDARFRLPEGVAADNSGNIYVSDRNDTIRKITPLGAVTTLAGLAGIHGTNDGTGSAARFFFPHDLTVDSAGNIYVADSGNNTIRKVTPAGVVTTLAGVGGTLGSGTNDGTGSAARFFNPSGVAVDSAGNLYVADSDNCTIRKVTPGGAVSTLAGNPAVSGSRDGTNNVAQFSSPWGVAVDGAGNVYVGDSGNNTIRQVTPVGTNWVVTTLAGSAPAFGSTDGTGSVARFNTPSGLAVDSAGNLYVADTANGTVRRLMLAGTNWVVTTLAGNPNQSGGSSDGTGSGAQFQFPEGVAVDSAGNLYVADFASSTIRRGFPANGAPVILTWEPGFGFASGGFGFDLTGAPGQTVAVDISTDLLNWQPIWTNNIGAAALPFTDPQGIVFPKCFYRAHLP